MDRLVRRNVLALSGRAVEASGDVDVLLLDKTGTITLGNRQASEFVPMPGVSEIELAEAAQLASLADETPEGRSIVVLAKTFGIRERELGTHEFVPFTAQTRMSGDRLRRRAAAQGRRRLDRALGRGGRRPGADRARRRARPDRPRGRHAAGRRPRQPGARGRLSQGHRQGRHEAPLRPAARDGHPHDHGHRRQPPDRGQDRRGGGRRRLPRRGHPGAQARADPRGAGQRAARGDDRRRHQRRARAGAGRRRRGHEHRHPGRPRGRATWSTSTPTRRS